MVLDKCLYFSYTVAQSAFRTIKRELYKEGNVNRPDNMYNLINSDHCVIVSLNCVIKANTLDRSYDKYVNNFLRL